MVASHRGIGKALHKLGKTDRALALLEEAIQMDTKAGGSDPRVLYNLACAQALCSAVIGQGKSELTPKEEGEKRRYAREAVATLERFVAAGYCDTRMRSDPDFEALRSLGEFKALVRKVEQAAKGDGE